MIMITETVAPQNKTTHKSKYKQSERHCPRTTADDIIAKKDRNIRHTRHSCTPKYVYKYKFKSIPVQE